MSQESSTYSKFNMHDSGVRCRFCVIGCATIDTFLNEHIVKVHNELVDSITKMVQIGGNDLDTE